MPAAANAEPTSADLGLDTANFTVSIEGGVGHLVLSRPDALNAMDPPFWRDLPRIVRELDKGGRVRCLVVSSTGKHFSAGMDLAVFGAGGVDAKGSDKATAAEAFRHKVKALQETFSAFEEARFPVIAAIQGGCIGGAVDLSTACDIRYVSADAFFQIQEINIGMTADVGTFPRLCKLMPEGAVRELAYTGRRLLAADALRLGLVQAVLDTPEMLLAHAMAAAKEIASKAPVAVVGSKRMITYARDHSTADALDYIAVWNAAMLSPEHMMEAIGARAQKRDASFPNLAPLTGGL